MDDVFNNESIWAFRVKEKPSRLDAEVEEAKRALYGEGRLDLDKPLPLSS